MDERFHRGIEEFNRRSFFEAHDILEELWHEYRQEDRLFLQGLIQVAVGCYHLETGNWRGARSQFSKATQKLSPYQPSHQGLKVSELLDSIGECLRLVERAEQGGDVDVTTHRFPTIEYSNQS
jgi:predicted metal-dependent hydrolase